MDDSILLGARFPDVEEQLDLFSSFDLEFGTQGQPRDGLTPRIYRTRKLSPERVHFSIGIDGENLVRRAFLSINRNLITTADNGIFVSLLARSFLRCAHGSFPNPEVEQLLNEISQTEAEVSTKPTEGKIKFSHAFRVYSGKGDVATLSNHQAGINVLIAFKRGILLLCLRPLRQSWLRRFFHRAR